MQVQKNLIQQLPLTAILALCLTLAFSSCNAPGFELAARAQMLSLDGELGASSGPISGSSDTDSLGLDDDETVFSPRVQADVGPVHVTADAWLSDFQGEGTAEAVIDIGGINLNVGDNVRTEIGFDYARALVTWDIVPTQMVNIGIGLGAGIADVSADFEDDLGLSADIGETLYFPMAAVDASVSFSKLKLGAVVSGVAYDYDDTDATFVDADVSASWELVGLTGFAGNLIVGYRHMLLDAEFEDGSESANLDLDISGPYAGITLSF